MRIPTRPRQRGLQFNITPLIDIIFLLIIFFLAASHFVRSEAKEPVELPEATAGEDTPPEAPRRLIVTIKAEGTLHVAGRTVTMPEVDHMILSGSQSSKSDEERRPFEVRIRGDRSVPYETVEPILLACARYGVTDVKFAVIDKSGSP